MTFRFLFMLGLAASALLCRAADLTASVFVKAPVPEPGAFITPRVLAVDSAASTCYILDSGLGRVVSTTLDGQPKKSWTLAALGVAAPLPSDPLLPNPALAVTSDTVYLLNINRARMQVELVTLEGKGDPRLVDLPDGATNGAVTVDSAGRVLVAFLQPAEDGGMALVLVREGANGKLGTLEMLADLCDGQTADLALTGFVMAPDGRYAIGIAQGGNPAYGMVRSWLVQGARRADGGNRRMEVTHRYALLNARREVQERFLPAVKLAGRSGYPAKPCVPLFTSLAIGPDGTVISGGHSLDPFLRRYDTNGDLVHSVPRQAVGGQHLALLATKNGGKLLATAPASHRIVELTPDGRERGGFGEEPLFSLAQIVSLAAGKGLVYAAGGSRGEYRLLCFSRDGEFRWTQPLPSPPGLFAAQPVLAASTGRLFVGWQLPGASGLGWVDTVLPDGSPGIPLWRDPSSRTGSVDSGPCATPLLVAGDGRVYLLNQLPEGVRLQAFSATGAYLQGYPAYVRSMPFLSSTVGTTWLRALGTEMWFVTYAGGKEQKWKRLPRHGDKDVRFVPVQADGLWGWLTSTKSLLRFDDNLTLVDEETLRDPEGKPLEQPLAIAGDGAGRVYLATPDRILSVEL